MLLKYERERKTDRSVTHINDNVHYQSRYLLTDAKRTFDNIIKYVPDGMEYVAHSLR